MTEQDTYIIERYLTGRLPREEAEAFEARLQEDPALKAETLQMRAVMAAVRQQVVDDKRTLLREESLKTHNRGPGLLVLRPALKYVAIAAALVLAVFMIRPILSTGPEIRNEYLAGHFDEFLIHDSHKGLRDPAVNPDIQKGYNLFAARKFDEAALLLEKNWEVHRDTVSLFYLVVSAYARNNSHRLKNYEADAKPLLNPNLEYRKLLDKLDQFK